MYGQSARGRDLIEERQLGLCQGVRLLQRGAIGLEFKVTESNLRRGIRYGEQLPLARENEGRSKALHQFRKLIG